MTIDVLCPHCGSSNSYSVSKSGILRVVCRTCYKGFIITIHLGDEGTQAK